MRETIESSLDAAWPARSWCDLHVVLAVSAGPDSVALLRAARSLKQQAGGRGKLYVAHLNHALRGSESDADENWLRTLCEQLVVPLEVGRANVAQLAASRGDGFEAAARRARYEFLRQTAERLGARFVATAHTADDQVETVLHRILRGTGLAGLAGIPAHRPLSQSVAVIRPLLAVRRQQVLEYLNAIGQDYCTDASNSDPRFTRNRLRNELLPLLRSHYNADVDAALLRLAAQADETKRLIGDLAVRLAHQCVEPIHDSQAIRINCRALAAQPDLIVREVLKLAWDQAHGPRQDMGFDQWQQLANLAQALGDVPAVNLPGNIRARRDGDCVILEPLDIA